MVLAWDRNSVLTLVLLPRQTRSNAIQFFGGVVQEKESNMGFCSRWEFPTRGMTVLSGTKAPRVGNAHLQQNPMSDSYNLLLDLFI